MNIMNNSSFINAIKAAHAKLMLKDMAYLEAYVFVLEATNLSLRMLAEQCEAKTEDGLPDLDPKTMHASLVSSCCGKAENRVFASHVS